jgi:hypothetical protein
VTFLRRGALGLGLLLVLTSCSMTLDASHLGVDASLASAAGPAPEGTAFKVTNRAVYGLWGLVRFSQPNLRKALATQLVGGKEVTNVRVRIRSKFSDLLITGLTLGLIVPRAVTIEGVVVDK